MRKFFALLVVSICLFGAGATVQASFPSVNCSYSGGSTYIEYLGYDSNYYCAVDPYRVNYYLYSENALTIASNVATLSWNGTSWVGSGAVPIANGSFFGNTKSIGVTSLPYYSFGYGPVDFSSTYSDVGTLTNNDTVTFSSAPVYNLTVNISPSTGGGAESLPGGDDIYCGIGGYNFCYKSYSQSSSVSLQACAAGICDGSSHDGWYFAYWDNGTHITENPHSFTVDSAKTVTAVFQTSYPTCSASNVTLVPCFDPNSGNIYDSAIVGSYFGNIFAGQFIQSHVYYVDYSNGNLVFSTSPSQILEYNCNSDLSVCSQNSYQTTWGANPVHSSWNFGVGVTVDISQRPSFRCAAGDFNQTSGYYGECVQYVRYETGIPWANFNGDADTTFQQAVNSGYATGSTPQISSIIVIDRSSIPDVGHVGIVTAIDGNSIWIQDANWNNDGYVHNHEIQDITQYNVKGYIYCTP